MAERGSTLLEVLVALAVLGLGVAGSAQLLLLGLATESQAALRELAVQRLADAAELVAAWPAAPPPARLVEWQANAAELRPDGPSDVSAVLDSLSTPGAQPAQFRAILRWGSGADNELLRATTYVPVATPP